MKGRGHAPLCRFSLHSFAITAASQHDEHVPHMPLGTSYERKLESGDACRGYCQSGTCLVKTGRP